MRHKKTNEKFSRPRAQRKALVRSLLRSIVINERIITTQSKAKKIRPYIEKLITLAKEDSLFNRRLSYRILGDHNLVKKLFDIAGRFRNRAGGYSRIFNLGYRRGDGAKMALLELTERKIKEKKTREKKEQSEKQITTEKEEKILPKKELQPKRGLLSNVRRIFKKERDSL